MKQAIQYISVLQKDSNIDLSQLIASKHSIKPPVIQPDSSLIPSLFNAVNDNDAIWPAPTRANESYRKSTAELSNVINKIPPASKPKSTPQEHKSTISTSTESIVSTSIQTTIVRSGAVRQLFTSTVTVSTVTAKLSTTSKPVAITSTVPAPSNQPIDAAPGRNPAVLNRASSTKASGSVSEATPIPSSGNDQSTQNVCEQIMKTPSLFQEATSQITQPKKYSDAVGKKMEQQSGGGKSSYSLVMGGAPPPASGGSGQTKLNLAPGTRPVNDVSSKVKLLFL